MQSYVLNGDVSLKDLASTAAAVTLNGQQKNVTVGFADKVTDGTADALTLNLNGVGTAEDAATTAVELNRVDLTAAGIEELNLGVAGTNVVTVVADAAKSVVATGEGSLDAGFSGSANVKTVDASAVAGNVTLDLGTLAAATSVKTGAGDDTISANTANLAVNATIDGGAGADRLELTVSSSPATTQYSMSGVETLALESSGSLTFSAKNVTGLETVEVASGYTATATLANLGSADLTFALKEDSSGSITADNAGAATVNVTPSATAVKDKAVETNTTGLTLTNASSVNLTVAQYSQYTGDVTALKATSLEAKIDGEINNTINLTAATAAVFNATNKDVASSVTLNAGELVDLNITTAGDFTVNSGGSGDLTKLEALTVATAGAFSIGDLAAINTINLTGTGTADLDNLGATDLEYGITVNASGLAGSGALTIADIDVGAGQSINLNVAGVAGDVTLTSGAGVSGGDTGSITVNANGTQGNVNLGTLSAKTITVNAAGALGELTVSGATGETVSITGSELKKNTITVEASKSGVVVGGIANDVINVSGDAAASGSATFTLTEALEDLVQAQGEQEAAVEALEAAVDAIVELDVTATPFAGVTAAELETYAADAAVVAATAQQTLAAARAVTSDQELRDDVRDAQTVINEETALYTENGSDTGGTLTLRALQVRAESALAAAQADVTNKGATLELAGQLTQAIGSYLAVGEDTAAADLQGVVTAYQAVLAILAVPGNTAADAEAELTAWKAAVDDAIEAVFAFTTGDRTDAAAANSTLSDVTAAQAVENLLLTLNNRFGLEETAAIREFAFSEDVLAQDGDSFIGIATDGTDLQFGSSITADITIATGFDDAAADAGGTALRGAEALLEARLDLIQDLADAVAAKAQVDASIAAYNAAEAKLADAAETLGYTVEELDNGFEFGTAEADLFLFDAEDTPATVIVTDFASADALFLGDVVQGDAAAADNNAVEFFITSNAAGDAVIQIENVAFGSATEDFTEITLTGVAADSLVVNGGLITVAA